jgi:hypothetical protein
MALMVDLEVDIVVYDVDIVRDMYLFMLKCGIVFGKNINRVQETRYI